MTLAALAMAVLLLAPVSVPASAAEDTAAGEPIVILHGVANGFGPVRDGGRDLAMTVRLHGDALRIDFRDPKGRDGYLLTRGGQSWLVMPAANLALPVPARTRGVFRVDPAQPCAAMGARCEPGAGEVIAGRLTRVWRYRDAGGRGPDGTDRGTLWVAPDSGLVLAFRGRAAGREAWHEFRVQRVDAEPADPALFALPRTLQQLQGQP